MTNRTLCLSLVAAVAIGAVALADEAATTAAAGPVSQQKESAMAEKQVTTSPEGCTVEKFTIHSPSMKREIRVVIVLPAAYGDKARAEERFPVLYTLHGMSAPYDTWSEMGPLRASLKDRPMIVTCLDGDKASWYVDATKKADSQFTTFFFDEFIPYVDSHYRTRPEARGVTGFSMGGYGAMQYMLTHPEMFASASSLSGAFTHLGERTGRANPTLEPLLGPFAENRDTYLKYGIFNRLEGYVDKATRLPPIMLACGTEDQLISQSRMLMAFMIEQNEKIRKAGRKDFLTFTYQESPGAHNWAYWKDLSTAVADFHWRSFQAAAGAKKAALTAGEKPSEAEASAAK